MSLVLPKSLDCREMKAPSARPGGGNREDLPFLKGAHQRPATEPRTWEQPDLLAQEGNFHSPCPGTAVPPGEKSTEHLWEGARSEQGAGTPQVVSGPGSAAWPCH